MGSSQIRNIFIDNVLYKTFIRVDNHGMEAGAATKVEMSKRGGDSFKKLRTNLNRPFIYAIIDNQTNMPIFLGTMHNPA